MLLELLPLKDLKALGKHQWINIIPLGSNMAVRHSLCWCRVKPLLEGLLEEFYFRVAKVLLNLPSASQCMGRGEEDRASKWAVEPAPSCSFYAQEVARENSLGTPPCIRTALSLQRTQRIGCKEGSLCTAYPRIHWKGLSQSSPLWSMHFYCPHFTGDQTESQKR